MYPGATGEAIGGTEWGQTIVVAFAEAAGLALVSIAILLWIVLRRVTDVLVTLIPLLVAEIVTLEICGLAKFQLNYANIIALPVLLGIGVAFKIYSDGVAPRAEQISTIGCLRMRSFTARS